MQNPEAVVFDLFGTLVPNFGARFQAVLNEMAELVGAEPQAFERLWRTTFTERATGVLANEEESITHVCSRLELTPDLGKIAAAGSLRFNFTVQNLVPFPDVVETLDELQRVGIRCGLISDCSSEVPRAWPNTVLAPYIDAKVFSCVEGVRKPHPRLYEAASTRLGVPPERCLYIGDGGSNELTGATRAGMRAILVRAADDEPASVRYDEEEWDGETIDNIADVLQLVHETHEGKLFGDQLRNIRR